MARYDEIGDPEPNPEVVPREVRGTQGAIRVVPDTATGPLP